MSMVEPAVRVPGCTEEWRSGKRFIDISYNIDEDVTKADVLHNV
jgi:hypothetical protein